MWGLRESITVDTHDMTQEDCSHWWLVPAPAKDVPALGKCKLCHAERLHDNVLRERTHYGRPSSDRIRNDVQAQLGRM